MITLTINTASSHTSIAIFENDELIGENSWKSQNDEAEKLMPAINKHLNKSKKSFSDIDKVFVVRGPGSFTGLRVGVTVANTIAYLNNCELFSITTFEYLHQLSDLPVLVFAGKGGVYLCESPGQDAELVNLDELNSVLKGKNIEKVFGDITEEQKSVLENIEFMEFDKSFGEIMKKVIQKPGQATKIVKPLYIKPPGITKSKKICST